MKITRRSLIKASVAAGVSGAVAGAGGVHARGGKKASRSGKKTSVGLFGYTPFTATFGLPPVLNDSIVNPDDGTITNNVRLDPASGTPEAEVGSDKVYHGYAPEYLRTHPVHEVANSNGPVEERWDRFTKGVGIGGSEVHYHMSIEKAAHKFFPTVDTQIFGYASAEQDENCELSGGGIFPAPTILARQGQPGVVRVLVSMLHSNSRPSMVRRWTVSGPARL